MPFYVIDPQAQMLVQGPTVDFPDGTRLEGDSGSYQGWEWFPDDRSAYEALLPERLTVLDATVATLQSQLDVLLDALGGE